MTSSTLWKEIEIGEIAKFSSGKTRPSNTVKEYSNEFNIPVYGGNGILGYSNEYIFEKPQLIIGRVGEYCGCVHITKEKSWITDNALYMKEYSPENDLIFLKYCFQYLNLNKYSNKMGQPLITQSIISKVKCQLPPLPEQQKIATVLSTVQRAIELQNELIERATELKKSMMHKLFTEGVKGEKQKETEIGMVPESWEVVPLGKYAMIKNGYAFKSKDYVKKGILSVRISNVSHGILIDKDNKYLPESYLTKYSDYSLKEGDLIISLTRPIISTGMKYCFIEKHQLPLLLNQRVGKFEVKDETKITRDYLYYIVFSSYFTGELKKLFGNSSQQPNVSPVQLEKFLIPLPGYDEQKQIFNTLHSINQKIKYHIDKKHKLEELFRTLLHQLMTAQVRVDGMDVFFN